MMTPRSVLKRSNYSARGIITTIMAVGFGFFIGVSFPSLHLSKINFPPSLGHIFDGADLNRYSDDVDKALAVMDDESSGTKGIESLGSIRLPKIHVKRNPPGAESLPPGIVVSESDFYLRRLWGKPSEDLKKKPKYLVTFTVGYNQRENIDAAVKKFSDDFEILLFHYDGNSSEWDQFEWSKNAIHVSARKQTKWWYAKRFLHPDIVSAYEYIFIWDEDLGLEHFSGDKYINLVKKHGLEISQPGLELNERLTWEMTKRRDDKEVHKATKEKEGMCSDPDLPPCAAFVEIMAPVFSRKAWSCVWYMIQNDLVHGWGLDFNLRRCVEPAHEKIGVVDSQWIVHQFLPSLGSQGEANDGKSPWDAVRTRCRSEWAEFQSRLTNADMLYLKGVKRFVRALARHFSILERIRSSKMALQNFCVSMKSEKMGEMSSIQLGVIGALFLSVASSVSIVICNKALMSNLGFPFATTLTSWHLMVTFCTLHVAHRFNMFEAKPVDMKTVMLFGILNGVSIGFLNLSLGFNSIGFYQMTKLAIIPFTVMLETIFLKKQFSSKIKLSLFLLLVGVGIASITDLQLNFLGTILSLLAIATTCVGQILTNTIQKKLNVSSTQLLYQSAPFQAAILFVSGPLVDQMLTNRNVFAYKYSPIVLGFIILSCLIAVSVNFSTFLVIGKTSPVTYQVLGHLKTCLVLAFGYTLLRDPFTERNLIGILVAIFGMGLYSYFCTQESKKKQSVDPTLGSQVKDKDNAPLLAGKNNANQEKESHDLKKLNKESLV
ncbi:hypothetical protein RIF29_31862 [Crotalaria pallida]|uniref:Sugar phosphate transporter domain-containing protein n=1 Tax=Crotalaria pallida TaxID=3830 RepID=A0AAN9EHM0_CROPI